MSLPRNSFRPFIISLGFLAIAYFASEVAIPVVLALFLAMLLAPLVRAAKKRKIPKALSAFILVSISTAVSLSASWAIFGTVTNITKDISQYADKVRGFTQKIQGKAIEISENTKTLMPKAKQIDQVQKVELVTNDFTNISATILKGVNSAFALVTDIFLIPILAFFFLLDGELFLSHLKNIESRVNWEKVANELQQMVRSYFLGNLVVGIFSSFGFYFLFIILGLTHKFSLSIVAGFLNLIPVLGAILGALPPVAQAILQFDHFGPALIIIAGSLFIHSIVNNFVMPKLVGSRVNLNASCVIIAMLLGGWMWGAAGLLLATPIIAMVRIVLSGFPGSTRWAELLSESPVK